MLELAGIIILGILAQWVAWKFKIPAILPLILIGLLVGPIAAEYLSDDGSKWIEPVWNGTKGLFPGESLYYFVSLSISIILFEGGLTLKKDEIKNVGPVITKLITLGSAITFFGAGIIAHFIFDLGWELSFLFSALIIVTGPTVITPILKVVDLNGNASSVGIGTTINYVLDTVNVIHEGAGYSKDNTSIEVVNSGSDCKTRVNIQKWNVNLFEKYYQTQQIGVILTIC